MSGKVHIYPSLRRRLVREFIGFHAVDLKTRMKLAIRKSPTGDADVSARPGAARAAQRDYSAEVGELFARLLKFQR
jgi:hypothetical protein